MLVARGIGRTPGSLRPSDDETMSVRKILFAALLAAMSFPAAANPLRAVGETFSDWKQRLFGAPAAKVVEVAAPAEGAVALKPGQKVRFAIGDKAPQRAFAKGGSRYRDVELPERFEHAAVRVQVAAIDNPEGRGHVVFKPLLYVYDVDGNLRAPVEVKPLHLDIRPFRRSRLLGCVTLDDVQRFAIATSPEFVGKSYQSEVREAVKAPTAGGFYYATDAVKVRLPYASTGQLVIEVSREDKPGTGC